MTAKELSFLFFFLAFYISLKVSVKVGEREAYNQPYRTESHVGPVEHPLPWTRSHLPHAVPPGPVRFAARMKRSWPSGGRGLENRHRECGRKCSY